MNRKTIVAVLGFVVGLMTVPALAATLTWDRNTEPDMRDYQVWACFTPSCVVVKSPSTLQPGTVLQPATGNPTYVIDLTNREGSIAVSARDQSLNESGLSVAVPFDQRPPVNPVNPRFQ